MELESIVCPFCEVGNDDTFWIENGFIGKKCANCGLIYISPRPTEKENKKLYEKEQSSGWSIEEHLNYKYSTRLFNRFIIKKIKKIIPRGKILEIGPGGGQFLNQIKNADFEPYAIEINEKLADILNEFLNIPTKCEPILQSSYLSSMKYDVIFLKDVLSHLYDPINVFKKLSDSLLDDGILIFETGNGGDLNKKWINRMGFLGYPEHVFLFSSKNIRNLLQKSNLQLIKKYHFVLLIPLLRMMLKKKNNTNNEIFSKSNSKEKSRVEKKRNFHQHLKLSKKHFNFADKIRGRISYTINNIIGRLLPQKWPSTSIFFVKKGNP